LSQTLAMKLAERLEMWLANKILVMELAVVGAI
jgi:hypothetical protein